MKDMLICAAAANIAAHLFADLIVGAGMAFVEQTHCGADLTRGAVSALKSVVVEKSSLHGVEFVSVREPLDRNDICAVTGGRQSQTGIDTVAVEQDGACAALSMIAAFLGARQLEVFAQCIEQGSPRIEYQFLWLAIDREAGRCRLEDGKGRACFAIFAAIR